MPRIINPGFYANFCEYRARPATGGYVTVQNPAETKPAHPNKFTQLGSKWGFRVIPLGKAKQSLISANSGQVKRGSTRDYYGSMCASPGFPVYVELDNGLVLPVTGPGWQRAKFDALTIRPWGDFLMRDFAGDPSSQLWTARYQVVGATAESDLFSEPKLPKRRGLVTLGKITGNSEPESYLDGFPVHEHFTHVRIKLSQKDVVTRWAFSSESWENGGFVNDGTEDELVWDEKFWIAGGSQVDLTYLDGPVAVYYQPSLVDTEIEVSMGFDY